MKCYYEILNVDRNCGEADVKSAYKKLALRWHPDKNIENPEEAKVQFQLVQQAYEVLSDAHERAWYDNHREQILRGKDSQYEDNCLNVYEYFSASCFKGYGDDIGGFYNVYQDVFEKLAAEDSEFMDSVEEIQKIPKFGCSSSDYDETVAPFYAYWQSYCTKKSFSWLCPYNIKEIKDRRILREIDKDMKKIVQKARKERNEEVRNLVSFVRKRDKRVQAYRKLLEHRAAENRLKQTQNSIEQFRKRHRDIQQQIQSQEYAPKEYEERLKELELEYSEPEIDSNSDNSISEEDECTDVINSEYHYESLYCVACNKIFKNHNAFDNHVASKKHNENTEKLIKRMRDEENLLVTPSNLLENVSENVIENTLDDKNGSKSKYKKNKKANQKKSLESGSEDENQFLTAVSDDDDDWATGKKSGRKLKKTLHKRNCPGNSKAAETEILDTSSRKITEQVVDTTLNHICATCKSVFNSKNKLFHHLKNTNHGVFIPKDPNYSQYNEMTGRKKKKNKVQCK